MAKILFAVPPLTGHTNPTIAVGTALHARGHQVAWVGEMEHIGKLIPDWAEKIDLPSSAHLFEELFKQIKQQRGLDSIRALYEDFNLPLARFYREPLQNILLEYQPDIIVCDHQNLACALLARKHNLSWISSVTTTASIIKVWDLIDNWIGEQINSLQDEFDLPEKARADRPDFSPTGCIVFSIPSLVGSDHEHHQADYHFVGVSIADGATTKTTATNNFPWDKLSEDLPKVLVSLGTISRDRSERFFETLIDACAELPLQIILVADPSWRERVPAHWIVESWVPQIALLKKIDAVLCHAGHNTTCEALSQGLPLVLAPIRDDQPVVARQVVAAGAGIALRFGRVTVASMQQAIVNILTEPSYRMAAKRLAKEFQQMGGASAAADCIESQLRDKKSTTVTAIPECV
jgi:MGT family glycosyltransferase